MGRTGTRVEVDLIDGRHRVRTRNGLLRAQRLHGPPDRVRVALVGQTALLLGGDVVTLDIVVGSGAALELSEVAGTVAYHGRGAAARWTATIRLERRASLVWAGEPLVVADGADVTRSTTIDLAEEAAVVVRETIVLGRTGERGGRLRATTTIRRAGRPILLEDLLLDPTERTHPGLLGDVRVLDSVLAVGTDGADVPLGPDTSRFRLAEADGTLIRFLGREPAASPLARLSWQPRSQPGPAMLQG